MSAGGVSAAARGADRAKSWAHRAAHRYALDYAAEVERAAFLDIIPTHAAFGRMDPDAALRHWFFHAQLTPARLREFFD